mmetsp:Transcript_21315/g.50077  ORF Transcript_21315/g.50077 Transcript_21315/m.50077 type:complete len:388 (+) Transcript_21315:20-1183(+)
MPSTENIELVTPLRGFVLKCKESKTQKKVFVNIVSCDLIRPPVDAAGNPVSQDHLDSRGLSNLRVPLDVNEPFQLKDSKGVSAVGVDVIFHPWVVERALVGRHAEYFKQTLCDLALSWAEKTTSCTLIKPPRLLKGRYKGGVGPKKDQCRPFPIEVPSAADDSEAVSQPPTSESAGVKVLDEKEGFTSADIKPVSTKKKTSVVKKGFFNDAKTLLYPNGSDEATPPPGAGDPMGWLPPGLRSKVHVVDPAAGGNMDKAMQEYAATGKVSKGQGVSPCERPGAALAEPAPAPAPVGEEKPKFSLEKVKNASGSLDKIILAVQLPRLSGMKDVDLDISALQLDLVAKGLYRLNIDWPAGAHIDVDSVKAQFSKKTKELKITAPVLPTED